MNNKRAANYGNLHYCIAQKEHDAALRLMLKENTIPGWITLSYERNPDFFQAAAIEGDIHDTLIGIDTHRGEIMAIGSRSVQQRFVNGMPQAVGYLGQLRVSHRYRNKLRTLKYGYDFFKRYVHSITSSPYYITSIISDNYRAKRLLSADLPGFPYYRYLDSLSTLALPARSFNIPPLPEDTCIEIANAQDIDQIINCLNRNNRRFQFASCWSKADLLSNSRCRGLSVENFFVIRRGNQIVGCLALWEQSAFKQVVVKDYSGAIRYGRPLINLFSRLLGYPTLPPIDQSIKQIFVSHFAMDNDDPTLLVPLLKTAINHAKKLGQKLVLFGLSQRHPCLAKLRREFRHILYSSDIYLVHWNDIELEIDQFARHPLHLDIAVL